MKPILALLMSLCLALPTGVAAAPASGRPDHVQAIGTIVDLDYWTNFARVPAAFLSQPIEWSGRGWAMAALAGAGVGLLLLLDEPIHEVSQDWRGDGSDAVADVVRKFGETDVLLGLTGGGFVAGAALGSARLAGTSLVALQALVLSQTAAEGLKFATHRTRPNHSDDAFRFNGPGGEDRSFVSGHATASFAVATVFAREFREVPLLAPALYGLATLTGLSRINDEKHWATDVVVGAALGYGMGYMAQKLSPFGPGGLAVVPYRHDDATGVKVRLKL